MRISLLLLAALALPARVIAQSTPADVPAAWAAASNAGDANALASLYVTTPDVTTIAEGRVARGTAAVQSELAGVIARARGRRITIDSIVTDTDTPTRARLIARWHVRTPPPDPRTVHGAVSMLLTRPTAAAPWRIAQDHWSVTPETPVTLPAATSLADSGPTLPARELPACRVTRIVDGDTLECEEIGRVRLIGIDTPERGQVPDGAVATAALKRLLQGASRVTLETDVEERDRYKRLLAYVWVDGRMANWLLAREGYATQSTYPPNVRYVERFSEAVRAAREERRGLWATGGFACDPKDFRRGKC